MDPKTPKSDRAQLAYRITYIKQKYLTINGVEVEKLPERQINAIYIRMRHTKQKKTWKQDTEYQLTFDDILKENNNGKESEA